MIGLVRELTRASLFAALSNPSIALAWRSRMKFSRVKALTMRMPCAVSCSDSIICIAPWNSLAMILRTRRPILRTPTAASGTNMSANSESSGILRHHHDDEADDRQSVAAKVVMRRLRTLLADWAMKACRAMNSDEWERL